MLLHVLAHANRRTMRQAAACAWPGCMPVAPQPLANAGCTRNCAPKRPPQLHATQGRASWATGSTPP